MIRDGKTVMVQITPSRTPFAMTTPMSSPSVSCMVHMARKPAIVVRELPVMEENVFLIAATMASSSDAAVSFSSLKSTSGGMTILPMSCSRAAFAT